MSTTTVELDPRAIRAWVEDRMVFIEHQARPEFGVVTWPNGADLDAAWMYEQLQLAKTCPLLALLASGNGMAIGRSGLIATTDGKSRLTPPCRAIM